MSFSFLSLEKDRKKISTQLNNSQNGTNYELNTELKDYIYEDNTIYETLASNNLLNSANGDTSAAAFCLLAKYEPTIVGGLLDGTIKLVAAGGAGGLIAKSLSGVKYLAGLSSFNKGLSLGLSTATYAMIAPIIAESCPLTIPGYDAYKMVKTASSYGNEAQPPDSAANLPKEVAYDAPRFVIDQKKIPSCKNSDQKNSMLFSQQNSACLFSVLMSLPWLKISLPALGYSIYQQ